VARSDATLILDALPWGVLLVDRDRRIRHASPGAADLLDASPDDLTGAALDATFRFEPAAAIDADMDAVFASGRGTDAGRVRIARCGKDPRADAVRVMVRPTADPDRVAIWLESLGPFDAERRDGVALERCLRVASQVRHGINNALMGVFGHADLILMDPDARPKTRERARAVLEEARKVRDRLQPLQTLRRDDD
jgi:nitrogen-specific signal transduction histidine kinase